MLYQPPEFKSHPLPSVLMMQCVPPQDCSSPPRTTKEKHLSPNPSFNLRGCLCSEPANHLHLFFHPSSSLVRSETHLAMPSITQQTWGRILVDRNRWIPIFFFYFSSGVRRAPAIEGICLPLRSGLKSLGVVRAKVIREGS